MSNEIGTLPPSARLAVQRDDRIVKVWVYSHRDPENPRISIFFCWDARIRDWAHSKKAYRRRWSSSRRFWMAVSNNDGRLASSAETCGTKEKQRAEPDKWLPPRAEDSDPRVSLRKNYKWLLRRARDVVICVYSGEDTRLVNVTKTEVRRLARTDEYNAVDYWVAKLDDTRLLVVEPMAL